MRPSELVVDVRDLDVDRGGTRVLHAVRLSLRAGEVTGLLGPSGCGKTTLMRALIGVQRIGAGAVTVLGHPAGSAAVRNRVGYVAQSAGIYLDLTVEENLRFFARVLAVVDDVERCLGLVSLVAERRRVVGTLSGGQRSRVSLAIALLGRPGLLVLDEPTVGLDPVLRRDLWATFRALADDGAAVLVSSHVMEEAGRCDRILLMREGRLLVDDTLAGVLASTGAADLDEAFLTLVGADEPASSR